MEGKDILRHLASLSTPAVLATVVSTRGSTPRKAGAKMVVTPDGQVRGTIGGGCGEGQVLEAAAELFAGGSPKTVRIDLTEDLTSWSPAVCGGVMHVFIEPHRPSEDPG